jgi:cell division protein FtsL
MDQRSPSTASRLINNSSQKELEEIFRKYGEIRKAGKLAKAIVERREKKPFTRTLELTELCERVLGKSIPGRLPSPTLCFQALRIAVNEELNEIEKALQAALDLLVPGGKIAAISFHSLEDRIVKNFFKRETLDCICPPGMPACICDKKPRLKILTKKPLTATKEEIERNPRASCAKLRVAEKIGDELDMNLHVRNLKKESKSPRNNKKNSERASLPFAIFKVFLLACIVFFIINLRISINEKTENLNRKANKIKQQIHLMDREIENLKIQRERLSRWPHIKKKIRSFRLALRSPEPTQIKELALVASDAERKARSFNNREIRVSKR